MSDHTNCVPREDYAALMQIMNHVRHSNGLFVQEINRLKRENQDLWNALDQRAIRDA